MRNLVLTMALLLMLSGCGVSRQAYAGLQLPPEPDSGRTPVAMLEKVPPHLLNADGGISRQNIEALVEEAAVPAADGEIVRQLWASWADKVQAMIAGYNAAVKRTK